MVIKYSCAIHRGHQQEKRGLKMNLISVGIIVEIFLFVGVFLWVRKLISKQSRQPSLSKKTIKNLKF
ncbi:hypothetical protein EU98_0421 [Prochlorococcus marinus str. MIT 9314]|uniref:Uncharacterized protein n=1 Tax=Prochlorococcus marinus str. MIT 9314 TaxID=167548 RepID=A0A0A2ALI7_PROMR|nr:hypothetical protein EU98_0421 [Prochlorococcus marinus str. MIT 9314]